MTKFSSCFWWTGKLKFCRVLVYWRKDSEFVISILVIIYTSLEEMISTPLNSSTHVWSFMLSNWSGNRCQVCIMRETFQESSYQKMKDISMHLEERMKLSKDWILPSNQMITHQDLWLTGTSSMSNFHLSLSQNVVSLWCQYGSTSWRMISCWSIILMMY